MGTADWSREDKLALAGLTLLILATLPFLVHPWYDPVQDGSLYLGCARAIAAGEGYSLFGHVFNLRPPGFSYLIAPWIALVGTNFAVLNAFVASWGAAGVLLLFFYERPTLGGPLAACVSLMVWLNPLYQQLCNQPMSDVPGFALLMGGLLMERWSCQSRSPYSEWILGVAIGFAATVRALNILLIPAILVSRVLRRATGDQVDGKSLVAFAGQRLIIVSVAAWLVLLPWDLYKTGRTAPPPADQVAAYDYATVMLHRDAGDPSSPRLELSEVLGRSQLRSQQLASVLGSRLREQVVGEEGPEHQSTLVHVAIALTLFALLCVAARRKMPAEIFCLGTLICVLFYFGFRERLALPVFALVFASAIGVVREGLEKLRGRPTATLVSCTFVLMLTAADTSFRQGWAEIERRHHASSEHFLALDAAMGPGARVGVLADQSSISVYLERDVVTASIAVARDMPQRRTSSLEAIERIIDKYDLTTIVSLQNGIDEPAKQQGVWRYEQAAARFLTKRYGAGSIVGDARFWRVRSP